MRNGAVRGCQAGSQASHRKVGRICCNLTRLPWCFKHMRHLLRQFKFCDQFATKTHVDSWRWSGQNWSLTHRNYVRRHLAILPRTYSDLRWHFEHQTTKTKDRRIRASEASIKTKPSPFFWSLCNHFQYSESALDWHETIHTCKNFFAPNFWERVEVRSNSDLHSALS